MITMAMGINKAQITPIVKRTSGSGSLRRTPALQAGFKTIDLMCIGGAGGRNTGLLNSTRGAGGGGGGSLRRRMAIKDLAELTVYGAGAKGADSAATGYADPGGDSYFGSLVATGGEGASAIIQHWSGSGGGTIPSSGGNGGAGPFAPIGGGQGGNPQGEYAGMPIGYQAPTLGDYQDLGNGNGNGRGGGGGGGRSGRTGLLSDPTAGAIGNHPGGVFGGPVISGHYGGYGGGATIVSVTGEAETYGTGTGGIVVFKLT